MGKIAELLFEILKEEMEESMNCTGENCIMQYDKVDPKTCRSVSFCPYATPPIDGKFIVMLIAQIWLREIEEGRGNLGEHNENSQT